MHNGFRRKACFPHQSPAKARKERSEKKEKTKMDIAITRASPEDAAEIIALMKIIGSESDNLSFDGNGIPVTVDEEAEFLKSIGHSRNEAFFVARRDSKIIGTAHYTAFTKKRMAHRGEFGICVRKSECGRGVGSMLLGEILSFAKDVARSQIVSLEVRSDNIAAIKLYEKFGFEKIGRFRGFFKINGEFIDFDIMQKFI